jgi:hypothetical protein
MHMRFYYYFLEKRLIVGVVRVKNKYPPNYCIVVETNMEKTKIRLSEGKRDPSSCI